LLFEHKEDGGNAGGGIGDREQYIEDNDPDEACQGAVANQESHKQGKKYLVLRQFLSEQSLSE